MKQIRVAVRLAGTFFMCWILEILMLVISSVRGMIEYPVPGKLAILSIYVFTVYEAFRTSGLFWGMMGMLFFVTMVLALWAVWGICEVENEA